jgi:hypothetical protein
MLTLRNQGIVLGEDSEKMSKSRGNVVAPDDLVKAYGADSVRAYLMFFARWDLGAHGIRQGLMALYAGCAACGQSAWNLPPANRLPLKPRKLCAVNCIKLFARSPMTSTTLNSIPLSPV